MPSSPLLLVSCCWADSAAAAASHVLLKRSAGRRRSETMLSGAPGVRAPSLPPGVKPGRRNNVKGGQSSWPKTAQDGRTQYGTRRRHKLRRPDPRLPKTAQPDHAAEPTTAHNGLTQEDCLITQDGLTTNPSRSTTILSLGSHSSYPLFSRSRLESRLGITRRAQSDGRLGVLRRA
eukprot:4816304-Pyramimonas_sp.AAC.1